MLRIPLITLAGRLEGASSQVPLQDGQLKAGYGLAEDAQIATVVVRDAAGDIVYSESGKNTQGVHEFTWDGRDAQGVQLPDGPYTIEATAIKGDDTPIETYITAFGRVTGVTSIDGRTLLLLGNVGLPIDDVLSVSESI